MADERIIIEVEANAIAVAKLRDEIKLLREQRNLLAKDAEKNGTQLKKLDGEIATNNESLKKQTANLRTVSKEFVSQAGSIEALRSTTAKLTRSRDQLDQRTIKGREEFKRLTQQINTNERQLKKWDTQIGKSARNVGNYSSAFRGLAGAMGITLGAAGIFNVLKDATTVIKDFGKQSAILAGVLNKEVDQITELITQAKELGRIYPTLAQEVLKLQEAYARLGFTQEEILSLTEATIKGSFALNASLDETANLTGAVVRAMDNLIATDSPEIMDKLSKSTQVSSLNFEKLSTALPKVAGAANAMGISLDEVLGQLAIAQDATQDASIAGTSLRNIYLEISKKGITLTETLNQINNSQNKLTTAQDLFGEQAAIVGLALANNITRTKELTQAIKDSAVTSTRVARTQMDTFAGAVDSVKSAWEGLVLSMQGSEGIMKSILENIANSLNALQDPAITGIDKAGGFLVNLLGIGKEKREEAKRQFEESMAEFRTLSINELQSLLLSQARLQADAVDAEDNLARLNAERGIRIIVDQISKINEAERANDERKKVKDDEELDRIQRFEGQKLETQIAAIDSIETLRIESADAELMRQDENASMSMRIEQNKLDFEIQASKERVGLLLLEQAQKRENLRIESDLFGQSALLFKKHTVAFKILASAEALINTYLAATEAYAALAGIPIIGPALGGIASGVAIAKGLKSVAEINGAKFAKGTILSGPSHANGGIPIFGSGGYYGEAEGGEPILTKGVSQNPYLLRAASDINVAGGGRPLFASGGITGSTSQSIVQGGQVTERIVYQPVLVVDDVTGIQNINRAIRAMAVD